MAPIEVLLLAQKLTAITCSVDWERRMYDVAHRAMPASNSFVYFVNVCLSLCFANFLIDYPRDIPQ